MPAAFRHFFWIFFSLKSFSFLSFFIHDQMSFEKAVFILEFIKFMKKTIS